MQSLIQPGFTFVYGTLPTYTTFSMYAKCAIRAHILSRIRLKSLSWNFLLIVLIRSKVVSLERRHIQKLVIEKYFLVSVYVPPHELTITNILFVTSIHQSTIFFYPNIYLLIECSFWIEIIQRFFKS